MPSRVRYVDRRVDEALRERARKWLASESRFLWISIRSVPGSGSTTILTRFLDDAAGERHSLGRARLIFVPARTAPERAPRGPSDLAEALAPFNGPVDMPHRLRQRLAACGPWKLAAILALGALLSALFVVLVALQEFAGTTTLPAGSSRYWRAFLVDWLPANWARLPILLLLVGSMPALIALGSMALRRLAPVPERHPVPDATREALVGLIRRAAARKEAVILAVDNAVWLSAVDASVLRHLAQGEGGAARDLPRVLIITIDPATGNANITSNTEAVSLEVEPLADRHLKHLILERWPEIPGPDLTAKLAVARRSLKSAFDEEAVLALADDVKAAMAEASENSIASAMDLYKVLALWAVRPVPRVTKNDLYEWLREIDDVLIGAWGWIRPDDPQALVKQFAKSLLSVPHGQTVHLSYDRSRMVVDWLRAHDRAMLVSAHAYWGFQLSAGASTRETVREAGWHFGQLSQLIPDDDMAATVPQWDRAALVFTGRSRQAATALLDAAVLHQDEAAFAEAESLVLDALAWAHAAGQPRPELADRAADILWSSYWYAGGAETLVRLRALAAAHEGLESREVWIANAALLAALRCEDLPRGAEPREPGAANLWRAAAVLSEGRGATGFLNDALRAGAVTAPEAVKDPRNRWAELQVREFRISQALLREDWDAASRELEAYDARLLDTASPYGLLHEILHAFHEARALHRRLWLDRQQAGQARDDLRARAEQRYAAAIHDATLLGMKPLLAEAAYLAGEILKHYGLDAGRGEEAWKTWEQWFDVSLRVDEELGWRLRAPSVHHARWEFFQTLDRATAVTDAFNLLHAMIRARFPTAQRLAWHTRVSVELNDFGDSLDDRRRSAELHELWARDLCLLPEALEHRRYKEVVAYEQASSLLYAAQAYRQSLDFARAGELLTEADRLMTAAAADPAAATEPAASVRELQFSLRLQRLWLLDVAGAPEPDVHRQLREIWADLRIDDRIFSNVLGTLVLAEWNRKELAEAWPAQGRPPWQDPINPAVSLPESWFAGDAGAIVRNRFEFRLLQLLFAGVGDRSAARITIAPVLHYQNQEHFGETALRLADIELQAGLCAPGNRATLTALLAGVRFYFQNMRAQDDQEMSALRCLMQFEPHASEHRLAYAALALRHGELLRRELQLQATGQIDFFQVVAGIHEVLHVLVNDNVEAGQIARFVQDLGLSPDNYVGWVKKRRAAMTEAASTAASDPARAVALLTPFLLSSDPAWVTFLDLRLLQCYISAALRVPAPASDLSRWTTMLQRLAVQYVAQYSRSIDEPEIQDLAIRLVDVLRQKAAGAPSYAPVVAPAG